MTESTEPKKQTTSDYTMVFSEDLLDTVCLCHAGLTQDAPELPSFYLNQVLNMLFGYITPKQRLLVDEYLADKKYLPPVNLILDTKVITP